MMVGLKSCDEYQSEKQKNLEACPPPENILISSHGEKAHWIILIRGIL